jgi:hypothetical protein
LNRIAILLDVSIAPELPPIIAVRQLPDEQWTIFAPVIDPERDPPWGYLVFSPAVDSWQWAPSFQIDYLSR